MYFGTDNVDFIGHRLSEGVKGLHDDNVRKIMEAARPTTKKQVGAFMGLTNYYRGICPQLRSCNSAIDGLSEEGTAQCSEVGGTPRARVPDPKRTLILPD